MSLNRAAMARCGIACLLLSLAVVAAAQDKVRIDEIRFVGNKTTKPQVMLHEMTFGVGDAADLADIEESRQAIMDLGLFKEVEAKLLPEDKRHVLQITVKEKIYLLPIPRVNRNADGDISYGGQLHWDNFLGLNQQIRVTYERIQPAQTNTSDVKNLSSTYSWPRIVGSPYSLNLNGGLRNQNVDATADGFPGQIYHQRDRSLGFSVSRLLKDGGPSRGWSVNTGLHWSDTLYTDTGTLPADRYHSYRVIGWTAGAAFTDVRDYLYSRAGAEQGYNLEIGAPWLGSDSGYNINSLYLRRYILITERPHVNFNVQLRMGVASGLSQPFALGSSDTLRGYPRDSIKGNTFLLGNFEYQQPMFGDKRLRGVVFLDVGNAYPSLNETNPFKLKASFGVGLRFRIVSLVKVQLRIDYGHALTSRDGKGYAGSNEAF